MGSPSNMVGCINGRMMSAEWPVCNQQSHPHVVVRAETWSNFPRLEMSRPRLDTSCRERSLHVGSIYSLVSFWDPASHWVPPLIFFLIGLVLFRLGQILFHGRPPKKPRNGLSFLPLFWGQGNELRGQPPSPPEPTPARWIAGGCGGATESGRRT